MNLGAARPEKHQAEWSPRGDLQGSQLSLFVGTPGSTGVSELQGWVTRLFWFEKLVDKHFRELRAGKTKSC